MIEALIIVGIVVGAIAGMFVVVVGGIVFMAIAVTVAEKALKRLGIF